MNFFIQKAYGKKFLLLLIPVLAIGSFGLNQVERGEKLEEKIPMLSQEKEELAELKPEEKNEVPIEKPQAFDSEKKPVREKSLPSERWLPPQKTSWQIDYSEPVDIGVDAEIFNVDLFDTSQATIDNLHREERKVLCYFSAGTWEPWRPDSKNFPREILGKSVEGWEEERWLDVRRREALEPIMRSRIMLAQKKGCDGVDPDNVDAFTNKSGFPLSAEDQLLYNRMIAAEAHARGLAVGLKNDVEQIKELEADFDFAVNESCLVYDECHHYDLFLQAGKPVFHIEYGGKKKSVCDNPARQGFNTLLKKEDLDRWRESC